MRVAHQCPHRFVKGDGKLICRHLLDTSGVADEILAEVGEDVCAYCCRYFEPRVGVPNPMVASKLFHLAQQVIAQKGVSGCTPQRAKELKQLALSHLTFEGTDHESLELERIHHDGPCFYLGEAIARSSSLNCDTADERRYHCQHQRGGDTTRKECLECCFYDQALATHANAVKSWAVGVTSAPRKEETLVESLASLKEAGWNEGYLFVEPDTPLAEDHYRVIVREHTLGAWPNFYLGLTELYMREPHADAYLMCQDDVLYARDLRNYLEENLWPATSLGVVSLHTAPHQDRGDVDGFFPADLGWDAWGAQAYVFSNPSLRALLHDARVLNHRHRGPREGLCNVDSLVGQWCRDRDLTYYLHTPSLTQHIGDTSTLWKNARIKGRRQAATYCGETRTLDP